MQVYMRVEKESQAEIFELKCEGGVTSEGAIISAHEDRSAEEEAILHELTEVTVGRCAGAAAVKNCKIKSDRDRDRGAPSSLNKQRFITTLEVHIMKVRVGDLYFLEIESELSALSDQLNLVKTTLPDIVEAERKRLHKEYASDNDLWLAEGTYLEEALNQGATTRFITAGLIIASWAAYEAAVNTLAGYVAKKVEASLRMRDLKREDFLSQACKYFEGVLHFPLHPEETDWERLEHIAGLRHALAHANGLLADLKPNLRKKLEPWVEQTKGLEIAENLGHECIVVSPQFAEEALRMLSGLVKELIGRVREKF